jgi:hypothetical protein
MRDAAQASSGWPRCRRRSPSGGADAPRAQLSARCICTGRRSTSASPSAGSRRWSSRNWDNPFGDALYLFINRRRDKLKALYWHRNGFCLWYKRLEAERFAWPEAAADEATCVLTAKELEWLLEGFDLWAANHIKRLISNQLHSPSGYNSGMSRRATKPLPSPAEGVCAPALPEPLPDEPAVLKALLRAPAARLRAAREIAHRAALEAREAELQKAFEARILALYEHLRLARRRLVRAQ